MENVYKLSKEKTIDKMNWEINISQYIYLFTLFCSWLLYIDRL